MDSRADRISSTPHPAGKSIEAGAGAMQGCPSLPTESPAASPGSEEFLAALVHELRNRIAPLRLGWEVVRTLTSSSDHRVARAREIIEQQIERMARLVDDVLEISRISRGKLTIHRERIDLRHVLATQAAAVIRDAGREEIRVSSELGEDALCADVDAARFGDVIATLLANAVRFAPPSGIIRIRAGHEGGRICIRIGDMGLGLGGEEHGSVFELFAQSAASLAGQDQGLAIALELCRRIVGLHGGSIEARAADAPGASEFALWLPAAEGDCTLAYIDGTAAMPESATGAERASAIHLDGEPADAVQSGPRILVVDDNPDVREYVASLLATRWQVETAANGALALEAVRAARPDLVLTDVIMPRLDGFGLLRALKDDPNTRTIPVIMLSARSAEEARVQGLNAGADDYLPKPFGVHELLARVNTHLDIARLRKESIEAAKHDPLTGLPNRAQACEFAEAVFARARRGGMRAAVLVIDLDRFKPINDTYGHDAGDVVLREVAHRLKRSLRGEDVVARLGGDEFLVILSEIAEIADVTRAARHIVQSLEEPIWVDGAKMRVSASIGIALFPSDGTDILRLMKCADIAMYHAKQSRNSYRFFTSELNQRASRAQTIENQLGRSLENREFQLHYQPIVDVVQHEVVGVEALVRWPHTNIGPEEFIPIAEMSDAIDQIGDWVMRQCCRQIREWTRQGLPLFVMSINVSPIQFRRPGLIDSIVRAAQDSAIDPALIQIELTETTLLRNLEDAILHMQAIKQLGMKLALDDFGKGYSSLQYLGRLPLDSIKIDQSFVRRLDVDVASTAVTEAILAIGRSLGLRVVAEGIESAETIDRLLRKHCQRMQGFYICPPLPPDAFSSWYRGWTGTSPRTPDA